MLRRLSEQRARVLAPVIGTSGRQTLAPTLEEISRLGERELHASAGIDSGRGYFRLDLISGKISGVGFADGEFGGQIADTLLKAANAIASRDPSLMVLEQRNVPYGVAYATYSDPDGLPVAIYGFTYHRPTGVGYWADRVFHETPLLPISYASESWNYDSTTTSGRVKNDSLLVMRISDRAGRLLWQSPGSAPSSSDDIRERAVIATAAGGFSVETTLRSSGHPALIPAVVRRAQRWSMGALLVLTVLLAAISLLALLSEREVARARRSEAMQQLALGLRHELNNALASVMLNAELVIEDKGIDETPRELVLAIIEQAERMRGVLRRLQERERLDVIVPYLGEGYMVDLSTPEGDAFTSEARRGT